MRFRWWPLVILALMGCSEGGDESAAPPPPPPPPTMLATGCGHAHNDYEHARPLLDALERGFCSVEADVWLVNDELLVAHELNQTDPTRTLQTLYLDPLRAQLQAGSLDHAGDGPLGLLIDVKSEAVSTYAALDSVLESYADILTRFDGDAVTPGAVTAVISGNRDRVAMEAQATRYAALDGRLEDLGTGAAPTLIPLVSQSWTYKFLWAGDGTMPADQASELRALVEQSHGEYRRLRFWSIPDQANAWRQLLDAGVDFINTDDLDGFGGFLQTYP